MAGSAACYIGLDAGEPMIVKAVACAVLSVKKSSKLLERDQRLNARCRMAHVYWENGAVLVDQALFVEAVDRGALAHAGQAVAYIANDIGPMIAAVYGGRVPLADATPPAITD